MQMPPPDPDTLFAELLQDLVAETVTMAREFKAFVRTKKFKTPPQLERVVFLRRGEVAPMVALQGTVVPSPSVLSAVCRRGTHL